MTFLLILFFGLFMQTPENCLAGSTKIVGDKSANYGACGQDSENPQFALAAGQQRNGC